MLGAASSAHQVEGEDKNSDWWMYEEMGRLPKSGLACDHYNRFEQDFDLAKQVGLNAMRISVEWSRIEPEEGKWSVTGLEHYKKVLKKLKDLNFARMVTLHHFTLPRWLAEKGGMETKEGIAAFARFAWFLAQNLKGEVDFWITVNEPEVYAAMGYRFGTWPPFQKSTRKFLKAIGNLIKAHKAAFHAIKQVDLEALVGIAKNSAFLEPDRDKFLDRLIVRVGDYFGNHYFLRRIRKHLDFIGLNYYFYERLQFDWKKGFKRVNENIDVPRSDMGWRTNPSGIYYLLRDLRRYRKPIFVTENGIANAADNMRRRFISEHLYWVKKAIDFGADVRGYFYWSLTDTYEWHDGFNPKFGLIEVNLETQERKIRESAGVFKEITWI